MVTVPLYEEPTMFHWFRRCFRRNSFEEQVMIDLTKLNTAVAELSADVSTIIAALGTPAADQAAIDGVAASLTALSTRIEEALTPTPPPPSPSTA